MSATVVVLDLRVSLRLLRASALANTCPIRRSTWLSYGPTRKLLKVSSRIKALFGFR